jgi:GNAT superfamily N-acetyltransferase
MIGMLSADFTIREARPEDLGGILHHRRAMFYEMGFTDAADLEAMIASSEPFIKQGLIEGFYRGWLVEKGGKILAGAGVVITPWVTTPHDLHGRRAYVLNVYTEPNSRRWGLARRLMEIIIEWCRLEGFGTVHLHASEAGQKLYESLGFKLSNEMRLALPGCSNKIGARE